MTTSSFRNGLAAAFTGAVLALVVLVITATLFTKSARAEEGEWTCPPPPAGCGFLTCFHNGTGGHVCKYMAIENGANCSASPDCEYKPWIE